VVTEELDRASAGFLGFFLQLHEEICHLARIIVIVVQDLCADKVRLILRVTRILQENRLRPEICSNLGEQTNYGVTPHDPAEHREGKLHGGRLGHLIRAMSQRDVAYLVSDDPGELGFVISCFNGPAIDIEKAARQRKCVYARVIHALELVRVFLTRGF
jgi:hypothetical protein